MSKKYDYVICTPMRPGCIAIGMTGEICKIDDSYVVKHPKTYPGDPTYDELRLHFMAIERQIYERLGSHKDILSYHGLWDDSGAIKLAYAKHGNLEEYISKHDMPSDAVRAKWVESLMTAFYYVYSCKVLHQDAKLNNVFVDDDENEEGGKVLKLADFGCGAIFPLDTDMEKVYAEDPLAKCDIVAIGCMIYAISTWKFYDYDFYTEQRGPGPDEAPATEGLFYRDVIDKCWRNEYHSIRDLYEDFQRLNAKRMKLKAVGSPRADFMLWFCAVPSLLLISGRYLSFNF